MSLNLKTNIEWCTCTWNPITGCNHGCLFCYARKIATNPYYRKAFPNGFKPTFYANRLLDPLKRQNPERIFTVDMGDMFCDAISDEQIKEIIEICRKANWHKFFFLTKNPVRCNDFEYPKNIWLGTSVESQKYVKRIDELRKVNGNIKYVSFEPLLGEIDYNLEGLDWIIIGGQTKPVLIPERKWVEKLITEARNLNISIFLKNNLRWSEEIREFPKG